MENTLYFLDTKTKSNIPEWSYFVNEVNKILNHYNPLNTHQWNYIVIKNKLLKDINNFKNESLDFYITNSERGWSW